MENVFTAFFYFRLTLALHIFFFFQPMGGKGNCSIVLSEVTGIGGVEKKLWAYHNEVKVKLTTP
jgi:hypothetical protein